MAGNSDGIGHDENQGKKRYCKDLAMKAGSHSMVMDAGGLLKPNYREQRFWGTDLSEVPAEESNESEHF